MASVEVLGIPVDNVTMLEAIQILLHAMRPGSPSRQVAFLNADCVNISYRDPVYRQSLQDSNWVFGDGIGVRLAAQAVGTPLVDNVNGTDLYPALMPVLALAGRSVYFLGARPGVAERMAQRARERWPGLQVAGVRHGYFSPEEEEGVVAEIRAARPDLLLVAFGAPRQDVWIRDNLDRLGARVAMGVGGLFDFYSGGIPRAPGWVRSLHMEWAYRLYQEPRRLWRRYLIGNAVFLTRVLGARLGLPAFLPEGARS